MGQALILIIVIAQLIIALGAILLLIKALHKPTKHKALVRTGMGGTKVVIEGAVLVLPYMHQVEEVDLSIKTFTLRQTAYAKDNTMVIIDALFYLGVHPDHDSVALAALELGAERTFDQEALKAFFEPKFAEAIKKVAAEWDSSTLVAQQETLKLEILKTVGTNLNGYALDDCIINSIEVPSTTQNY